MADIDLTEVSNRKLAAGLLAIFLGLFGIHKFVLGYTTPGVIMLVIGLVGGVLSCGLSTFVVAVIGVVEGILYLTKTPQAFQAEYIDSRRPWF